MLDLLMTTIAWGMAVFCLLTLIHKGLRTSLYKPWKETKLASLINLDKVIGKNHNILLDRDGRCHMILEVHGQDFAALSNEDRAKKLTSREIWVRRLSELNLDFKVVSHKTEVQPQPLNKQAQPHLARADDTWEHQFQNAHQMRHFFTSASKTKAN